MSQSATVRAQESCGPPQGRDWNKWLKAQEGEQKGHTLACHVGKTAESLMKRLKDGGSGKCGATAISGGWTDVGNLTRILDRLSGEEWQRVRETSGTLVIDGSSDEAIGIVVAEGEGSKSGCLAGWDQYVCKKTNSWRLVFSSDGSSCYLLTAFPTWSLRYPEGE